MARTHILTLGSADVKTQPLHSSCDEATTLNLARAFEHITESP